MNRVNVALIEKFQIMNKIYLAKIGRRWDSEHTIRAFLKFESAKTWLNEKGFKVSKDEWYADSKNEIEWGQIQEVEFDVK